MTIMTIKMIRFLVDSGRIQMQPTMGQKPTASWRSREDFMGESNDPLIDRMIVLLFDEIFKRNRYGLVELPYPEFAVLCKEYKARVTQEQSDGNQSHPG